MLLLGSLWASPRLHPSSPASLTWLCHRSKQFYLSINESNTYLQHTERHPKEKDGEGGIRQEVEIRKKREVEVGSIRGSGKRRQY